MPHVMLSIDEVKSYETSPLSKDNRQTMMIKLQDLIENEKPYMNPDLTLSQLASQCGIPVHHLSQILNKD